MARIHSTTLRLNTTHRVVPVFRTKPVDWAFLGDDVTNRVRVGDIVHFDWGGENWGYVTDIQMNYGGTVLFIENSKGFSGPYLSGRTEFRFPSQQCYRGS